MRKFSGIIIAFMIVVMGLSAVHAETIHYTYEEQRLADTPTKYGPKGLYTLFSPDTYQKGRYGLGFYWDMTRQCLPGDPRYPSIMEFTLAGAYGITDKLEVSLAAPFRHISIPTAPQESRAVDDLAVQDDISESGFSNLSLGLRYKVTDWMTPYVQTFFPTASDPEKGTGADNTRIHVGTSLGTVLENMNNVRLYGQVAYQIATDYDQDRQDFSEVNAMYERPRFERFGTNPMFHEYGNTLFYGAGFAIPLGSQETMELFSEFDFYHSFDDEDYIPMFEDGEELDVVQDGGMFNAGLRAGFGNGIAMTAGGGAKLFAEEPMYESPHYRFFAGLTYNQPHEVTVELVVPDVPPVQGRAGLGDAGAPLPVPTPGPGPFDCTKVVKRIHFEFDKATLTPEAITGLQQLAKFMRVCGNMVVEIQGHTDTEGTENYNMKLGARRARAILYYLYYDEGIELARLVRPEVLTAMQGYDEAHQLAMAATMASYGESQLLQMDESIAECKTPDAPIRGGVPAGCYLNRRGEFKVMQY